MENSIEILPGDIEAYCLGMLIEEETIAISKKVESSAVVKKQVDDFIVLLEQKAFANSIQPPSDLKSKIFDSLKNLQLEETLDINDLPLINKFSDYKNWLKIVHSILPEKQPTGMFVKEIKKDDDISQLLMWTAVDYPDEVHHDEEESFIVLKGKCRCFIEDTFVELGPGDFLDIPLHHHHNVEILEPVIAIVQRRKIA